MSFFQICIPIKDDPRFKCICKAGYELVETECRLANRSQFLLYGQQKPGVVRGLDIHSLKDEVIIPMIDLARPTALDYHAAANHLYLADSEKMTIERQELTTGTKEVFIDSQLNSVMGMAIDWIGHNLYWTDEGLGGIFVSNLVQPKKRLTLLSDQDLAHPRSIVVDSLNGLMYWSNWPPGPPLEDSKGQSGRIELAWLDGSHRKVLLDKDLIWPNGLTIDDEGQRIYWCDSYLLSIESMSLTHEGSRTVHLSHENEARLSQPYSLTLHANQLFWSEFEKGHIMKLDLSTSNVSLVLEENPKSFALKVFDRSKQKHMDHPCQSSSTCQDLCLLTPDKGHSCKCRDGSQLALNGSCQPIPDWKPPSHCRANQFKCRSNFKCIDERYR